ncbi:SpoIIE family protein phosphatase [Actinoplanes oblitus]|uniref:SpoIIE family protein phosphatase n=1 Tax=Actinoplanes oblitus TaxID=3040509 RepID=A0ABY8WQ25_9ACTN|nr:SpoIIE family protein phosphatase [Actinoplanes oblitus]WIM98975.1 SpoIIE family protein phosphatase [Actinoplanes oblitus]
MTEVNIPEAGDLDAMLAAVDQLPFIVAVFEGDELRLAGWNAATRAVVPGRDAIGRPIEEVLSDLVGQQFVDAYHEVYRTGEPIAGRQWRAHLDQPDGSVHEMFATFTIVPWRDPDGSVRGVIGAAFDVTELARTRQAAETEASQLRRRYEQSRDVITELQRELLPAGLPVLPGLQLAASYLLADAETAAGGDWFDAVPRADGLVALLVGDVVGHGITASGAMGQLRAVLQERLDSGASIGEALAAADRFAGRIRAAHATTVCLALLDPVSGELTYCTAGHPPPLVISAAGRSRFLPPTGGSPLGTGGVFPVRQDRLALGDLLLLYSDGIVERPLGGASSIADLTRVATDAAVGRALHDPGATAAERVCGQTIELLVRTGGHADDITLLAAQRVEVVPELVVDLPADPAALRGTRAELGAWLSALGAAEHDAFVLQHALGELTTNAIEHAGSTDKIRVRAVLTAAGRVEATVTDYGGWRAPERQPIRGRGLALTAQLVESLRVEPGEHGTVATVRHPLNRPARLLARFGDAPGTASLPAEMSITELPGDDEARVRVDGPMDAESAVLARQDLLRRSRGGTVPMTVDLTGVTHLASAGVAALFQIAERHHEQKAPLTLIAAPGSPARQILDLVGLPASP